MFPAVYRLLLSTFFNGSIMNVIFIMMSFAGMGPRLEQAHGTTAFLIMMLSLSVVASCLYLVVCVTLAYNPIKVQGNRGKCRSYRRGTVRVVCVCMFLCVCVWWCVMVCRVVLCCVVLGVCVSVEQQHRQQHQQAAG